LVDALGQAVQSRRLPQPDLDLASRLAADCGTTALLLHGLEELRPEHATDDLLLTAGPALNMDPDPAAGQLTKNRQGPVD
jgi:hypothetical protein